MTQQTIRLKIASPALKLRVAPRLTANLAVQSPVALAVVGGVYTISLNMAALIAALGATFQPNELQDQHITTPGPVNILAGAGIVRVDQAVGAPITLNMPLATAKTCAVLISDWKMDAGTNNITINATGTDKFPGGFTSWKIAADGGSVFFRPIPGVGYAI